MMASWETLSEFCNDHLDRDTSRDLFYVFQDYIDEKWKEIGHLETDILTSLKNAGKVSIEETRQLLQLCFEKLNQIVILDNFTKSLRETKLLEAESDSWNDSESDDDSDENEFYEMEKVKRCVIFNNRLLDGENSSDITNRTLQQKFFYDGEKIFKETFESFGFKVSVYPELSEDEFLTQIKKEKDNIGNYDNLLIIIICISCNDQIFISDKKKYHVINLLNEFQDENLKSKGKPKVFLIFSLPEFPQEDLKLSGRFDKIEFHQGLLYLVKSSGKDAYQKSVFEYFSEELKKLEHLGELQHKFYGGQKKKNVEKYEGFCKFNFLKKFRYKNNIANTN